MPWRRGHPTIIPLQPNEVVVKDFKQWKKMNEDMNMQAMGRSMGGPSQQINPKYVRLIRRFIAPIANNAVDEEKRRDPNLAQNPGGEQQIRQKVASDMINAINFVLVGQQQSGTRVNYNQLGRPQAPAQAPQQQPQQNPQAPTI